MIFLLLALVAALSTSVCLLRFSNATKKQLEEEILKRESAEKKIKEEYIAKQELMDMVISLRETSDRQKELIKKLSQKELINACRDYHNTFGQKKKDILAAINSLESSFNTVKQVYSTQTTVDDCVMTIKPTPIFASGEYKAAQVNKWPSESKYPFNPC